MRTTTTTDKYTHYDPHGETEWACGGDDDCRHIAPEPQCIEGLAHEWTHRGCGGCDGVWSLGGTVMRYAARCRLCGCARVVIDRGQQRNRGECDQVTYEPGSYDPDPDAIADARRRRRRHARYVEHAARALASRLAVQPGVEHVRAVGSVRAVAPRTSWDVAIAAARLLGVSA